MCEFVNVCRCQHEFGEEVCFYLIQTVTVLKEKAGGHKDKRDMHVAREEQSCG